MNSSLGTHYLEQYWPASPGNLDMWQDNVELLQTYFHCARSVLREAGRPLDALDIGTGPCLAPLLASMQCMRSVQLSDYAENSRTFLASSSVDYWREYAREVVRLYPDGGLKVEVLLAELDQKRRERAPLDVDLRRTPTFLPNIVVAGSYPLVTMHFVADSISRQESECLSLLKKALAFVAPGGFALLSFLIDSTWWMLGDSREPSPKLSEDAVDSCLSSVGFEIREKVRSSKKPNQIYDGRWTVYLVRRSQRDARS